MQIRDLVHTIQSSDLTSQQIRAAFGEIFLSRDTLENQLEAQEIVEMMRIVKSPTYSQHIPNSAVIQETPGSVGLTKMFTPEDNKTYRLLGACVTNAGNVSNVEFGLQDDSSNFVALFKGDAAATATTALTTVRDVTFDSNVFPAFLINTGDENDLSFIIAYCELVQ